ncbi:hypothetical protein QC762_603515 [Podospora pseudocomata]|uniref:Uncharacterized protein n=1 Tax=Podospora pseudocomata TaxID=2093779 RepID=A0ABR0G6Z5_9PEZI|nr:hypothetical protein QC762_603515 [Podospora pseudocomata]
MRHLPYLDSFPQEFLKSRCFSRLFYFLALFFYPSLDKGIDRRPTKEVRFSGLVRFQRSPARISSRTPLVYPFLAWDASERTDKMWTTFSTRDEPATPLPLPARPPTSSSSSCSPAHPYPPLSPNCEHPQPMYRVYPHDNNRHHQQHHVESEYCHARRGGSPTSASTTAAPWDNPMVDLPYVDYAQVEIQSQSIKVIRSPLSLVKSVASRLPTSPYMLARAVSTYATRSRSSSPPASTEPPVAPPLPNRPRIEEGYSPGVSRQGQTRSMEARARESESGVNWDYGSQGIGMLSLARQGGNAPDLERMNYINSLAYLMRGLPADLTPAEASTIRQSTPASVVGPQPNDYSGPHHDRSMPPLQRSIVHHIAFIVLNWLYAFWQVFAPFLGQGISGLLQFERDNQLINKMAMSTFKGAKNAYVWFSAAYVGQLIAAFMAWVFQGVHGALTEFRAQSDAVRAQGGGFSNQQQPSRSSEEWERRRMYEQQRAQHQGWPSQNYSMDCAQLARQGL